MSFPNSIDSFTNPAGTSTQDNPDHAGLHTSVNGAITAIETVVGTTAGTNVLKNFAAGDLGIRQKGGTVQDTLVLNGATLGTPKANFITSTGTTLPVAMYNTGLAPQGTTVSDSPSGTIVPNLAGYSLLRVVFGTTAGNRTFGTPSNPTADQTFTFAVKASGSANATVVWDSNTYRFSDAGTPAIGTAVAWNYFGWRYNATDSKMDFMGQSKFLV